MTTLITGTKQNDWLAHFLGLAQVHLVERIPFFDALYFVTTTLTTVGYGDVVVSSTLGKVAVLGMICVGVVLIPVQTSQLYAQLTARRVTLGAWLFFTKRAH